MDREEGPNAIGDLKGLIFIMVLIIIAWILTGGYKREISLRGPYLTAPTNIGERGEAYGSPIKVGSVTIGPRGERSGSGSSLEEIKQRVEEYQKKVESSGYADQVFIESTAGARDTNPGREYIVVRASRNNKDPINISGFRVASGVTGNSYEIGLGSYLPYIGQTVSENAIYLNPGEKAVVTSGRSPIGMSFRTNLCTGYLSQFQDYSPSIPLDCPAPRQADLPFNPQSFNDACRDFIDRIPRCKVETRFPDDIKYECRDFIARKFNYSTCVNDNKNQAGFYGSEWRIFLKRNEEIWKSRYETIKLLDQNGKIVDVVSF